MSSIYVVNDYINTTKIVKFKKLHPDAVLPTKAKLGDAGLDLTTVDGGIMSEDGSQITYSTGLAVELPPGHVGLLFPRSSIVKTALTLGNSVGVIDEGYRGEIKAVFNRVQTNILQKWAVYKKGDRIVQLVVLPIPEITTEWAEELSSTERGEGGWGSSGS